MRVIGIWVVAMVMVAGACTRKQAVYGVVGGTVLSVGGGVVVASSLADEAESDTTLVAGGGVMVVGLVVLVASVMTLVAGPVPPAPPEPGSVALRRDKRTAQVLAEHGECARVKEISARVAAADPKFHAASFATDAAIARCLARP